MVIKGDNNMFIKRGDDRGDGKIISVIEEDNLTDEQKRAAKDLSKKTVKKNSNSTENKLES
jgi:hypothetical protein